MTLNQVVNLGVAVGQNLPYNHVVQAWNAQTGAVAADASRRRSRTTSCCRARRSRTSRTRPATRSSSAPASTTCATSTWTASRAPAGPSSRAAGSSRRPRWATSDGDGKLEVTTMTREGYMFAWDTDRPACGTNDEWWTSRHDEWNTGAYGTDTRPPGTPHRPRPPRSERLQRRRSSGRRRATTGCAAPPSSYRMIASSSPIEHPTRRHGRRATSTAGAAGSAARARPSRAADRQLLGRALQGRERELGPPGEREAAVERGALERPSRVGGTSCRLDEGRV